MENYLDKLNSQQRDAVVYTDGPALVIAGAGSGKTRVLTYKIVHLLGQGFEPWRILALTFTNKAAREMRERIEQLVGPRTASSLWMGTFHSIFARILRQNAERIGFKPSFTIYDTADSKSLVKSIIKEMDLDDKIYKPSVVLSAISSAKNSLVSPEQYALLKDAMEADRQCRRPLIYAIYRTYRDRCFAAGAMDFDDLLYYTNILLRDNPDVLHHYQEYFRYVLVDEYQDTNFAQHAIVKQLCEGRGNLCVVGDDAQSIYSFRGANIRNILDLNKTFPGLRTFKLEENYRSSRNIIGAANTLIAVNTDQIRKEVFSNKETGDPIEVAQAYNDYEEAAMVVSRLMQVKRRLGLAFNDIAILYRTNAQSRVLEEALRNRNVPYHVYGGLAFYQRKEVKDALAYFRLSVNPYDDQALERVINTPKRGIGDTTVNKLKQGAISKGVSLYDVISHPDRYEVELNKGTKTKLSNFAGLINFFIAKASADIDAYTLAKDIIQETGLLNMYMSDSTPENISKQENLYELLHSVEDFTQSSLKDNPENSGMADYLATVSLLTDQDTDEAGDRVTLMTIHAAKGLEFGAVFVVGVEENLLPSGKSHTATEIEEERRLMYVAITRAKMFCMLSFVKQRTLNGSTQQAIASRFITDIDSRYLRLMTGTRLQRRSTYGGETPRPRRVIINQPVPTPQDIPPVKVSQTIGASTAPRPSAGNTPYTTHDIKELSVGMTIIHSIYGEGVVKELKPDPNGDRIIVTTADGSSRTLLLKFARFTINK